MAPRTTRRTTRNTTQRTVRRTTRSATTRSHNRSTTTAEEASHEPPAAPEPTILIPTITNATTTPAIESLEDLPPEELEQLSPEQLDALVKHLEEKIRKREQIQRIVAYREILQSDNAATVPGPSDVALATAETSHDSSDVALIRQAKRPRIEAADSEKAPALPKMERYHGKTIPEYNAFVTRFGVHFRRNSYWYDDAIEGEKRKIDAMLEALDDKLLVLWNVREKEIQGRAHSYEEFLDWLQGLVRPTELLKQDANQKYNDAKQLPTQSVVEFAAYLAQWESQLDFEYSERQRINHLRAKVLPVIRDEAARYPDPPETYDAYVLYLQKIEEKIPGRRESTRGARSQRNPTSKNNVPSWNRTIDKKTRDGKDPVRTDAEPSRTNRQDEGPEKRCSFCNKTGHTEDRCFSKKRLEKRPRTDNQQPKN